MNTENFNSLITKHAFVAWKKMRKPTQYEVRDLEQEARLILLKIKKSYSPDRNCSLKTLFTTCLRNRFANLVRKSYNTITEITPKFIKNEESSGESIFGTSFTFSNPLDILTISEIMGLFNPEEFLYIKTTLAHEHLKRSSKRGIVRKILGINWNHENSLRKSIYVKLTKYNK